VSKDGLVLKEMVEGMTFNELQQLTAAKLLDGR
jgi:acyl CoA:acetate/3-ketoacid CoA transferase beta subunit